MLVFLVRLFCLSQRSCQRIPQQFGAVSHLGCFYFLLKALGIQNYVTCEAAQFSFSLYITVCILVEDLDVLFNISSHVRAVWAEGVLELECLSALIKFYLKLRQRAWTARTTSLVLNDGRSETYLKGFRRDLVVQWLFLAACGFCVKFLFTDLHRQTQEFLLIWS